MNRTDPLALGFLEGLYRHFQVNQQPSSLIIPLRDDFGKQVNNLRLTVTQGSVDESLDSINNRRFRRLLYNFDSIPKRSEHLIITFGIPAVWRLWQKGYPKTIGLLANDITDNQLRRIASRLKRDAVIWVLANRSNYCQGMKVARRLMPLRFTQLRRCEIGGYTESSVENILKIFEY